MTYKFIKKPLMLMGVQFISYSTYVDRLYRINHYRKLLRSKNVFIKELMGRLSSKEKKQLLMDLRLKKLPIVIEIEHLEKDMEY